MSNKEKKAHLRAIKQRKASRYIPDLPQEERIRQHADSVLKKTRIPDDEIIKQMLSGKSSEYPSKPYLIDVKNNLTHSSFIKDKIIEKFILFIYNKTKILEYGYAKAIKNIINYKENWIRDPYLWKPNSHNAEKQLSSLLRHLFCKYKDVPLFMDKVWNERLNGDGNKFINWYISLGLGKNIRTLDTPVPLTKKQAHYFMQAPKEFSPFAAIRYGQILDLGGNEFIAEKIIHTNIGTNFYSNEFWMSVFRFFINNPMLDTNQYGPIIDYIHNQKFVIQAGMTTPLQPNFSMKDRNVDTLLKYVSEWHKQLGRMRGDDTSWLASTMPGFSKTVGKDDRRITYTIEEILTKKRLIQESRELSHCASSYAQSCKDGKCSIWSLSQTDWKFNVTKLITIEVRNGSIIQARGKYNRPMLDKERNIIQEWANQAKISMRTYL